MSIQVKRIYEPPERGDGTRVLVDRMWPRGLRKEDAAIDQWMKSVAPSSGLRKWFGHDPARWEEFERRYAHELEQQAEATAELRRLARRATITLLYAARDEEHNNAVALRDYLTGKARP